MRQRTADREKSVASPRVPRLIRAVTAGSGDFLFVRFHGSDVVPAGQMRSALLDRSTLNVDDVSARLPHLGPRLRLAVRQPETNQRFTEAPAKVAASGVFQ